MRAILIPGNGGGGPNDNWFPYLSRELPKLGIEVVATEFPDSILARESYWVPFLKDELKVGADSILIGHSSGAIAAMRVAETTQLLGSILVGTYYTDLGLENEKLAGYFNRPWDFQAIKANQNWIAIFASIDDPWISIEEPRFLHDRWKCDYFEYTDRGHFGGDYYKPEFPEIVEYIKTKISR